MVILWRRVLGVAAFMAFTILLVWALTNREAAESAWEAIARNFFAQGLFFLTIVIGFPLFVLWLLIRIIKMVIGWIKA